LGRVAVASGTFRSYPLMSESPSVVGEDHHSRRIRSLPRNDTDVTDRKAFPAFVVNNNWTPRCVGYDLRSEFAVCGNKPLSSQSRSQRFNVVNYLHPVNHAVAIWTERSVIGFWVARNHQSLKLRNRHEVMNRIRQTNVDQPI
jgi:hypothetical protein